MNEHPTSDQCPFGGNHFSPAARSACEVCNPQQVGVLPSQPRVAPTSSNWCQCGEYLKSTEHVCRAVGGVVPTSNQRLSVRVEALIEQMYEYRRPFIGIGFLIEVLAALRSSDVETTGRHADSRPAEIQGVAVKDGRAIVYGSPGYYGWLPEDDASQHNCDAMGCGQFHVLARIQVDRAAQKATAPTWEDLRGIAPDATGTLSSEEFVRETRNAWDQK